MKGRNAQIKDSLLFFLAAYPILIWVALKSAPYQNLGVFGILSHFSQIYADPLHFNLCDDSLPAVFLFTGFYVLALGIVIASTKNYRRSEEHGSAKWGAARSVNRTYRLRKQSDNKLLTQNVRIGLQTHKHRRNLNTLVVGGSGSGKTRFYAKPNLLQANTSFVVLDPKGELLASTGCLLREKGYTIKILDLIKMDKSFCYNPFVYIKDDNDVMRLVTNIIRNTTPKNSTNTDPFWGATRS